MIYISAGHWKYRPGACYGGFCEFELATDWADIIHSILGGDRAVRVPNGVLKKKVEFINLHSPKLAVEIHFNSAKLWRDLNKDGKMDDNEWINVGDGSETLYYPGSVKGKAAAELMQERLSQVYPPNRGAKEGWYQMNPKKGPDFFLAKTSCTSLIIEPEFIDNLEVLQDKDKKELACNTIAQALLDIVEEIL